MGKPTDAESLVRKLIAGATPDEQQALLKALLSGHVSSILEKLEAENRVQAAVAAVRAGLV